LEAYNASRSFDFRVKLFGFVQTLTPDRQTGDSDVLPIAPYGADVRKSMKLQWVDFSTGDPTALDWHGTAMAGTIGVTRLAYYVENYAKHPEAKAADWDGNPAGPDTIGMLYRLAVRSHKLARIGKEVDRLDEDEGAALEPEQPIEYARDDLAEDIAYLAQFSRAEIAAEIGMTERRWRDIARGITRPRDATATRIAAAATERRDNRRGTED
jgi:hypothetical protein